MVTDLPDSLQAANELKYSLEKNKDSNLYDNAVHELRFMLGEILMYPSPVTLKIIEVMLMLLRHCVLLILLLMVY